MKIQNQTAWNSRQIRSLVLAVAKLEMEPEHLKVYTVHVKYLRNGQKTMGEAYIGTIKRPTRSMRLYLPKTGSVDVIDLAHTIAHEFAHNRGVTHHQMIGSKRYRHAEGWREFYAWASQYPIERVVKPAKPRRDVQEVRYERVMTNLRKWRTKLKRAQTAIAKLARKQRYYEAALAAKRK